MKKIKIKTLHRGQKDKFESTPSNTRTNERTNERNPFFFERRTMQFFSLISSTFRLLRDLKKILSYMEASKWRIKSLSINQERMK
jgi:hypothetical protein